MPQLPRAFLRVVLMLWLVAPLAARAQLGTDLTDHIEVIEGERFLTLQWSDTDDVLKGALSPSPLTAGKPFTVSLRVQPLSGPAVDMPLVITLRQTGEEQGASQVVKAKDGVWVAKFTPEHAGPYLLDVSFRTTHPKVLHAGLTVRPSPVPSVAWVVLALVLIGIPLGIWRRRRQEVRQSAENAQ